MSRNTALGMIVCTAGWLHASAMAAEGRVAEPPATLDAQRTSQYVRGAAAAASKSADVRSHKTQKPAAAGSTRLATPLSPRFPDFHIYAASSTLRSDRDDDGYHAEFRIRFDADVAFGGAWVYAKLYLRRAGENAWLLYHETDDFYIEGQTSGDEYYVTTMLDDGYATAEYDVLIDLYEAGFSGIAATLGPLDSGALSYLPLEEAGLDLPIEIPGYGIRDIATELIGDRDRDGYYSTFRMTFDPDADFDSRLIYARIWVRPRGGDWVEEFATEDFQVDTSGTDDAYVLDVEWRSGYPTSLYDVQIDLHDSASDLLVASAGSDWPALSQIPLEDRGRDWYEGPPTPPSGGNSSSREGGGGAFSLLNLLWLAAPMLARALMRRRRSY